MKKLYITSDVLFSLYTFFLVFLCLYGPRLNVIDIMAATTSILMVIGFLRVIKVKKIEKYSLGLFVYILALLLLSSFHYYYHGNGDPTGIGLLIKLLIYFFSAHYIVNIYFESRGKGAYKNLYTFILYATALNGFFVILFYFIPSFSTLASQHLDYTRQLNWLDTGHRMFDLSLGGGASASFVFSLAYIIGIYIFHIEARKRIFISLMVIAFSTMLMGRTGLYIIIISTLLYILFLTFSNNIKITRLTIKVVILFFLYALAELSGFLNDINFNFSEVINWSFEIVINYIKYGKAESDTTDAISNMWFYPTEVDHFTYGDGNFGRQDYLDFIPSDIGYVRLVFGYGVLGCILMFSIYVYMLITSFLARGRNNIDSYITGTVIILFFLMNAKEFHFASRGSSVILFMIYFISIEKGKYNNES
ncbi:hypothetical protein R5M54_002138 [Vibrio alginolyticus]|nr:hypothetical protein [Vibrio alginolyticus]ELS4795763.1 hypothetical protein [Vibrio alginolyticus]MDW1807870.1 hypothetical protein [Vibrio sp. Vb2362]